MNLNEAMGLRQMVDEASTQSRDLTFLQAEALVDIQLHKYMNSKKFVLVKVPTNKLAQPIKSERMKDGPIVVDFNAFGVGEVKASGYTPKVIVLAGSKRFMKASFDRDPRVTAWVGENALKHLGIKAGMSSDDLRKKIQDGLEMLIPSRKMPADVGTIDPYQYRPTVIEVFPLDGYAIYGYDDACWKVTYTVDADDNVTINGRGIKVKRNPEPYIAASKTPSLDRAIAAHCSVTMKGKSVDILELNKEFKAAVSRGYKPKVKAVSPPGWKGVTRKMKEDHAGQISNPWALAWWMDEQGYTPHVPESADK